MSTPTERAAAGSGGGKDESDIEEAASRLGTVPDEDLDPGTDPGTDPGAGPGPEHHREQTPHTGSAPVAVPGSFGGIRRPGALGALAWSAREAVGWSRWMWRQLTSMRVALILLFLLSLGSIPGSLVPQNSVDVTQVRAFKADHPSLTPLFEKLQLFDVYTSVWFSAVYILLFVSLAGCIVPRTRQFLGQLRSRPPQAPRRLTRLPAYTGWHTDAAPEQVLTAAGRLLGRRRFRSHRRDGSIAAEKGYLREAGNLVFHISLIVLLLAFAAGQLWKSEGGKLIVQGDGFSNTLTQYDDFSSGTFFDTGKLDSFGFRLDDFHATFERTGPQRGTPRDFRADVSYWRGADGAEQRTSIEVNEPLRIGGSKVFLIGHGYAPVVTVRDGQGDIAYRGPVPFLPQDGNLTSSGVVKVTDYRGPDGAPDQLGFQGFFVPTWGGSESGSMFSQFPAADYPVLFLTAYHGDLGLDAGLPQNVYQLDTSKMEQFTKENGDPFAEMMLPGESMKLPGGAGTLTFERVERWASFQISSRPGGGWALGGAVAAVLGLTGSLFIQRRRVWVRAVPADGGGSTVELAALGRGDSPKIPDELGAIAEELQRSAPPGAREAPDEVPEGEGERA